MVLSVRAVLLRTQRLACQKLFFVNFFRKFQETMQFRVSFLLNKKEVWRGPYPALSQNQLKRIPSSYGSTVFYFLHYTMQNLNLINSLTS
jgi:hypothetical protein